MSAQLYTRNVHMVTVTQKIYRYHMYSVQQYAYIQIQVICGSSRAPLQSKIYNEP
jgi:hypothetical protein